MSCSSSLSHFHKYPDRNLEQIFSRKFISVPGHYGGGQSTRVKILSLSISTYLIRESGALVINLYSRCICWSTRHYLGVNGSALPYGSFCLGTVGATAAAAAAWIKGDKANKWEQGYGYGLAGQSHVTNLAI